MSFKRVEIGYSNEKQAFFHLKITPKKTRDGFLHFIISNKIWKVSNFGDALVSPLVSKILQTSSNIFRNLSTKDTLSANTSLFCPSKKRFTLPFWNLATNTFQDQSGTPPSACKTKPRIHTESGNTNLAHCLLVFGEKKTLGLSLSPKKSAPFFSGGWKLMTWTDVFEQNSFFIACV